MSYTNEEKEHLENFLDFIKRYGITIVLAVLIVFGGWGGWKYWKNRQIEQNGAIAEQYEKLIKPLSYKNPETLEAMNKFRLETDNVYGTFAAMSLAKEYVKNKEYEKALEVFSTSINNVKDETLAALINLRIARLQYQLKANDEALRTLDKIKDVAWSPLVKNLQGDIFVTQKNYDAALNVYQSLLVVKDDPLLDDDEQTVEKDVVRLKINQVQYLKSKQQLDDAVVKTNEAKANKTQTKNETKATTTTEVKTEETVQPEAIPNEINVSDKTDAEANIDTSADTNKTEVKTDINPTAESKDDIKQESVRPSDKENLTENTQ